LVLESHSSDQRCYHIGTKTKDGVRFAERARDLRNCFRAELRRAGVQFFKLSRRVLNLFLLLLDRLDDAGARPARSIKEGVRAVRVVYFGNDNPAGRRPLQGCCEVGGPNAPSRSVIKFDDVTLVVLLDAHTVRFHFASANPGLA
jgi:hypothetical protein